MEEAPDLSPGQCEFESHWEYMTSRTIDGSELINAVRTFILVNSLVRLHNCGRIQQDVISISSDGGCANCGSSVEIALIERIRLDG